MQVLLVINVVSTYKYVLTSIEIDEMRNYDLCNI